MDNRVNDLVQCVVELVLPDEKLLPRWPGNQLNLLLRQDYIRHVGQDCLV